MGRINEVAQRYPFEAIWQMDASKVNQFFGINQEGVLDAENLPKKLSLGNLWRTVAPIIDAHPWDRELYIGWDVVRGRLKVTEVTEGLQRAEILAQDPQADNVVEKILGQVDHRSHLLSFHTHVSDPSETQPTDRYEVIFDATPKASTDDMDSMVLVLADYAAVILDTKLRNRTIIGRILVALKTSRSWKINNEADQDSKMQELKQEMNGSKLFDISRSGLKEVSVYSKEKVYLMTRILNRDDHWNNFTGVALYRGILQSNLEVNSSAYRWDVYHERLRKMRRKFLRIF